MKYKIWSKVENAIKRLKKAKNKNKRKEEEFRMQTLKKKQCNKYIEKIKSLLFTITLY